jgi:hypothetical protein
MRLAQLMGRGYAAGGPGPNREEMQMDEQTHKARELDALEIIAAELAKLRMLREYEIGAEVREVEGNRYVQPIEK